jgi:hypothetical protein
MAITHCRFFRFSLGSWRWIDGGFLQFIARDAPARIVARRADSRKLARAGGRYYQSCCSISDYPRVKVDRFSRIICDLGARNPI